MFMCVFIIIEIEVFDVFMKLVFMCLCVVFGCGENGCGFFIMVLVGWKVVEFFLEVLFDVCIVCFVG